MNISAIILAAGQSRRMGRPKMILPWGNTTVLGRVIGTIQGAGIGDIVVITGGAREEVERSVEKYGVRFIHNHEFAKDEMLASIQLGIRGQNTHSAAVLICLGDQPQVEEESVRLVCRSHGPNNSGIIVPSHQMRRGHPWLVGREHWDEILAMRAPASMRDFLQIHQAGIVYVETGSPGTLQDLDTFEDYLKYRP